ncbi:MAG: HNH endonuclease [Nostoc sp.]|uniref:HNH endonuclease n=1 Tax=Nostoc sp. TaxID=1180 RepID=UPI002FF6D389
MGGVEEKRYGCVCFGEVLNHRVLNKKIGVQQMMEFNPEQLRENNNSWTSAGKNKGKVLQILKRTKKVIVKDVGGGSVYELIKPQEHGIKKALLERPLLADTSVILQKLIVDILHTTTERNVRELILTAMRQMKWETELFTKQLETHIAEVEIKNRELSEAEKEQVKKRDGYVCLCCGVNTKGKLKIDYIKPSMGGETSIENFQTLCVICSKYKGNNETDFRCNTTKLSIPKNLDLSFRTESQHPKRTLKRIVNLFYDCNAVYNIKWEVYIYTYTIYLYPNNNPEWLLQHKAELLKYIQDRLGGSALNIEVTTTE